MMNQPMNAITKKLESALLDARWLAWTLVFFAVSAWIASAVLLARGVTAVSSAQSAVVGLLAAACLLAVIVIFVRYLPRIGARTRRLAEGDGRLLALIAIGLVLRLAWSMAFDAKPSSDGLTYLELATKLASGQPYYTAGTFAYWPPGYAFFLSPFVLLLGTSVAVLVSQLLLFCVSSVGLYKLTERFSSSRAALLAVGLFCLWPNLIAHCGTPEKESLVAALLIWAVLCVTGERLVSTFMAGLLLGAVTLVQPSTLLLIPAIGALLLIRQADRAIMPIAVLLLGAALVIAPWTARNYQVLGGFKLVSTNGGGNLYRANNPLANGGYTPVGEIDLSHLSELDSDRTGKELAFRWIKDHPLPFIRLILEKELRFMGDDAGGVYGTFLAEKEKRPQMLYFALKMMANLWWLVAWAAIASLVIAGARLGKASFLAWGWIYLFALHSVFESAGKYHVPILWIPCMMMGILLVHAERLKSRDSAMEKPA
jgi:hypothetical protein